MRQRLVSLSLGLFAATTTLALAEGTPSPAPSASAAARVDTTAHNGGTIEGRVSAVDFSHGTLEVDAPGRGKVSIVVPPSTSVQGKDSGYHSVTDLVKGTAVQILTSERAGRLTAQLIRIK